MSDYISKSEAMHTVTKVELKDGTFTDVKMEIGELQTISETQIIRKAFERVVERFEKSKTNYEHMGILQSAYYDKGLDKAIEICKEEGGIE